MKIALSVLLFITGLSGAAFAQMPSSTPTQKPTDSATTAETKRPPVFKANKDQIMQAQKMLKDKGLYSGEETGKLDDATRDALKKFQTAQAMPDTGTLNRATLEKMNIALTDKQKAMPYTSAKSDSSMAMAKEEPKEMSMANDAAKEPKEKKPREAVFRANKDQIMQAQKMLKDKSFYAGEQTGKLDDATREGLKKFQEAEKIKVTGTLNRETLEKMNIALTDKQKTLQMPAMTK